MKSKKMSILITSGIVVAGLLISNLLSNQKESLERKPESKNTDKVKTVVIENKNYKSHFETSGRLQALNKIEIYAEVSGVLKHESINFKEGNSFKKGQILVHIDDEVYRNNVLAQKSILLNQLTLLLPDLKIDFPEDYKKWENYLSEFDLEKNLKPLPKIGSDQEKYYIASRNIFNLYYSVKSLEATLNKYCIRAPYDGIVTESNLNPGTLVRNGQKLGEFTNSSLFELKVAVGINEVNYLKPGIEVTLNSQDISGEFTGKIIRINNSIDQASETVKVFIQISDSRLKDGMYLNAKLNTESTINAAEIPRSALTSQSQVYVLVNKESLNMHDVEIIENKNDKIYITGLENGLQILSTADDSKSFNHNNIN